MLFSGDNHGNAVGADHTERQHSRAEENSRINTVGFFPEIDRQCRGDAKLRQQIGQQAQIEVSKISRIKGSVQPQADFVEGQEKDHTGKTDQRSEKDALDHPLPAFTEIKRIAAKHGHREIRKQTDKIPGQSRRPCAVQGAKAVCPDMDIRVGITIDQKQHIVGKHKQNECQYGRLHDIAEAKASVIRSGCSVGFGSRALLFPEAEMENQEEHQQSRRRE